jgi:hypothetical protein
MTTQLDHVIIDRYGIVIFETKVRNNALIRGRNVENRWTACYPGRRPKTFENPLEQNRQHENIVRQALQAAGAKIDPDYVGSAVVFVGARIDLIELSSLDRGRVMDIPGLSQFFAHRSDFAVNSGAWTPDRIDYYETCLRGLDKSDDPAVLRQHSAYRGGSPVTTTAPTVSSSQSSAGAAPATHRAPGPGYRRAEPLQPPSASPSVRRRSGTAARALEGLISGAARLLLFAFLLGLLWLCAITGVLQGVANAVLKPAFDSLHAPQPSGVPASSVTLETAKATLKRTSGEVYTNAMNLDSPDVSVAGGETTYTWRYATKPTPNSVRVNNFSIVFGPDGQVRTMGVTK